MPQNPHRKSRRHHGAFVSGWGGNTEDCTCAFTSFCAFCPTFPTPISKAKLKAAFQKKILFQEKRKIVRQLYPVALIQISIKRQGQKKIQPWTGGGLWARHLALVIAWYLVQGSPRFISLAYQKSQNIREKKLDLVNAR